jgi:hypothetical protein
MSTNLWPDFDSAQAPRSPKAVVEHAGKGLSQKTKGIVVFTMFLTPTIRSNEVEVGFSLYVQSLMYHFPFLRIRFGIESMYPVKVIADRMTEAVANDENELIETLTKIFNAPSTVATIQRLISLAKE